MDFRILGPLEVCDSEGRPVELGGRQQRLVLAMLLLQRNEVVSVDRLIDVVWGDQAPANAPKNIQIHVSRLRKALERASRSGESESTNAIVRTRANGYVLEVAPGEVDLDRFQHLVEEGRRALAAREFERAVATLRDAFTLWRGGPLADFAYDSFAQGEIRRLDELRLGALEDRINADLALGREEALTAELQGLVAEHQLRERLRGQLMVALYRCGRKAEALRVYEEIRRALAEELGIEPSESLQALQRAVLTDDSSLSAPLQITRRPDKARVAASSPLGRRWAVLLGVGSALVLAAAVAVAVLEAARDRTPAGLASVEPNSLAAIDPDTNRVVSEIPVGARPASVLSANGSLWVANLDDDTVSRIDPKAARVIRTIPTGTTPTALASGPGAVWAIGGEGVVLRIDPVFNQVVDRIETVRIGSLLTAAPPAGALAATSHAVWAISGGFFATPRLFRINPKTKRAEAAAATGNGPRAIAVGFGDLWVTDSFENTVSRIDPAGAVIATIPVGYGASAVAVGEGAVWIVDSLDDAVVRIDPETNSVTTTIQVGRYPTNVTVGEDAVWVANRDDASVSRIDPKTNSVMETIELGSRPAGLVIAAGAVWVTSQAGGPASRSGTASEGVARLSAAADVQTDPALYPDRQINYATCAKLLNYPDEPAPAGTRLVPEVATSLPVRSDDGRTYTFRIREGFAFSPPLHERVTAQTFKYSIERSLHPKFGVASSFVTDIAGEAAYESGKAMHISGVVAEGNKLSITLIRPAPDFLARIAMPFFCAVPVNTPINPKGERAIPSAGPYYIAEHVPNQRIVLRRNPNYHGSRPRRLREIRYMVGAAPSKNVADVEAGRSDYLVDGFLPPDPHAEATLAARYGPASAAAHGGRQRYFVNPTLALAFLALNTSRPLFSDVRWRRAVNYAIDRRALARQGNLVTGPFPAMPTDHYLPPTMPGASRRVLYPPNGDRRRARQHAPETRDTAVLYTCNLPLCRRQAQTIKSNLGALGLDVDIREFPVDDLFERAGRKGEPYDIITAHWGADYADPSDFLNVLLDQSIRPRGNLNVSYFTDARVARKLARVARLFGEARYRAYAAFSTELAQNAAPWVAYSAGTSRDFFSARIGCQVFQPVYGMDLGALCIRHESG